MSYKRPPFDELAADRRIKQIASNMMAGNNDPRELREAWGLMADKAADLFSPGPPPETGIAGRVAATIKRGLGLGS